MSIPVDNPLEALTNAQEVEEADGMKDILISSEVFVRLQHFLNSPHKLGQGRRSQSKYRYRGACTVHWVSWTDSYEFLLVVVKLH